MGMFDNVKFKAKCWRCKNELTDFQTKDGEQLMKTMTPKKLGAGKFYSGCYKCNAWNEYRVIPKEVEIVFDEAESKLNTPNEPHI